MFMYTLVAVLTLLPVAVRSQNNLDACSWALRSDGEASLEAFNGVCYKFVDTACNFERAFYECKRHGAYKAMPKTRDANDFLVNALQRRGWDSAWIGLDDKEYDGTFQWADGTYISDRSYSNFADGNGNKRGRLASIFGRGKHCVAINMDDRQWHDYPCDGPEKKIICQVV